MSGAYHIPVLLHDCVTALDIKSDGIYADATFGGGGHSREILARLGEKGKLFAFDQDADAEANKINDARFTLIRQNFSHLQKFLKVYGVIKIDGLLADLGVSSWQFDMPERGFSHRFTAELDMRMDRNTGPSASEIIKTYSQSRLQQMFSKNAELRNARQLSEAIVSARQHTTILHTTQLNDIAISVAKGNQHKYCSQVFQALRIEVNDELGALRDLLLSSLDILKVGGRLVVISYHSLEDRMVKNFMKTGNTEGMIKEDVKGRKEKYFRVITKKPVVAGNEELKINTRSASAKMRAAEKIELNNYKNEN